MKIIGLLSDFGLRDSYVAEMKAVILSICPEVRLVDISHEVRKFDVRMGAFVLASAARWFPDQSIFLAVVDPEVGSERKPLIVRSSRSLYVGPDNGLLMLSALREGLTGVYCIRSERYLNETTSTTFHGRDLFARVVGELANGASPLDIGVETKDYVELKFDRPIIDRGSLICEAMHVDDFGNIVTNAHVSEIDAMELAHGRALTLEVGRRRMKLTFVRTYNEIPERTLGCLIGSHGFLEIAMRKRNASRATRVSAGSRLRLSVRSGPSC
jgi:S-adenosylmethionine hydrolase